MDCPRCQKTLDPVVVGDVRLDACPLCRGIWFDHGELGAVSRVPRPELEASPLAASLAQAAERCERPGESDMLCPRCQQPLYRYEFMLSSGVLLDGCEAHGIWLDGGELGPVLAWLEDSSRELTAEEQEQIRSILEEVRKDADKRHEALLDSLVKMDNHPGLRRYPGRILQSLYRALSRLIP
jgi:Zn-finger nucleic acid-binding protein